LVFGEAEAMGLEGTTERARERTAAGEARLLLLEEEEGAAAEADGDASPGEA
jgi:hypothetical protein